jgi:hypothetical protein
VPQREVRDGCELLDRDVVRLSPERFPCALGRCSPTFTRSAIRQRQLTHFTGNRTILHFAWSRDGKHLTIARSTTTNDIVQFKGLKPADW